MEVTKQYSDFTGVGKLESFKFEETLRKIKEHALSETQFYDVSQESDLLPPLDVRELPQLAEVIVDVPNKHIQFNINKESNNRISGENKSSYPVLNKIFEDFDKGRISFVGPAGSGKTTLLKIISRELLNKKIASLKDVEHLFFLNCQNLDPDISITLEDLIFQNIELDHQERQKVLELIKTQPQKCLFVVDAADNLDYDMQICRKRVTGAMKFKPARLLWQLVQGNTFVRSRIITSERFIHPESDIPPKLIALSGLSIDSIKKISNGYLGEEDGDRMLKNLQTKSPSLLSLCSTPVFLTYTIIGEKMVDNFKPRSKTGVMIRLLQSFIRSKIIRNPNIEDIFPKLKELSSTGFDKNKAFFNAQDLERYHLTFKETGDFTSLKGIIQAHKDQQVIYFNHLSIQMIFAAMFIVELRIEEFKKFLINIFNNLRYTTILQHIFGLVLDNEVTKASDGLIKVDDLQEKRDFLRQILRSRINSVQGNISQHKDQCPPLNFLSYIHEANTGVYDIIEKHLHVIRVENVRYPLSPSDAYIIGSVAQNCGEIECLSVLGTDLQPYPASILKNCLKKSTVSISKLCISHNPKLKNGVCEVSSIISHCNTKEVQMCGCFFTASEIDSFLSSLKGYKVDKIDLSVRGAISQSEMKKEDECRLADAYWNLNPNDLISKDLTTVQLNSVKKDMARLSTLSLKVEVLGTWKKVTFIDLILMTKLLMICVREELVIYGWRFDKHFRKALHIILDHLNIGKTVTISDEILHTKNTCNASEVPLHFIDLMKRPGSLFSDIDIDLNYESSSHYTIMLMCDGDIEVETLTLSSNTKFCATISNPRQHYFLMVSFEDKVGLGFKNQCSYIINWNFSEPEKVVLMIKLETNKIKLSISKFDFNLENLVFVGHGPSTMQNLADSFQSKMKIPEYFVQQSIGSTESMTREMSKTKINSKLDSSEEHCDPNFLNGVETEEDMIKQCQEQSGLCWNEMQIAHTPLTEDKIKLISKVVSTSSCIKELGLRDVGLTKHLLSMIESYFKKISCQIREFSINCEGNISEDNEFLPLLCNILSICNSEILNLSENDISDEFLNKLLPSLRSNLVKTLRGLDLSNNMDIEDLSSVVDFINAYTIEELRMMNCGMVEERLLSVAKILIGKLKRLYLSFNPDMTPVCFEIIVSYAQKE